MNDELELLRHYREMPGPTTEAWLRARSAIAAAREEEHGLDTARSQLPQQSEKGTSRSRWWSIPTRRWRVCVAIAAPVVAVVILVTTALSDWPGHPTSAVAAVLSRAAQTAADQPPARLPGQNQYLYVETQQFSTGSTGLGPQSARGFAAYSLRQEVQLWLSPRGGGRKVETPESVSFLTPADALAWKNAFGTRPLPMNTPTDETLPAGRMPLVWGLSYPDSTSLPTAPVALERAIVERYERGHQNLGITWDVLGSILQSAASPSLRKALYEVAARLPGVHLIGPVTDDLGRAGIAVALTEYGIQNELIFDPNTSAVLEDRQVRVSNTAAALAGGRATPIGMVENSTMYVATGIANSATSVP